jgi:hypothetical protein
MKLSCPHREVCWVDDHLSPFEIHELCIFWETNVIADANSDLTIFCVENGNLRGPRLNVLTLIECDTSWYVDIEEMKLPVLSYDIPFAVKAQTCVEDLILTWNLLWETTTDYVFAESLGQMTEELGSLTFLVGFVVRKQGLLELEHVILGVGGVKHLGEYD